MKITACSFKPSRRAFIRDTAATIGAFTLGTWIPFSPAHAQSGGPSPGPFDPNMFLQISPDNSVTLISKHLEMGQGVTTGLATLVAEELDADWSQMRFVFAAANAAIYNNLLVGPLQATGGSTSTAEAFIQMRQVGAAARAMFVAAAAASWNVPAAEIVVSKGVLSHGSNRATFGSLAAAAMQMAVPTDVTLKQPKDWRLIGTHVPRLDSAIKTTGEAVFALDVRRPGMLTVVVLRPEVFGATVASFDAADAKKVDGVVDVQQLPSGVAVYATNTWAAIEGRNALRVTWDTTKAEARSTDQIFDEYRSALSQPGLQAIKRGDASGALGKAVKVIDAEFTFPYLAHAPMEPLNCIMELSADGAEIWAGSQLQTIDQAVAAQVLGLKPEQVKINTLLAGGSFGRRGNPVGDWIAELSFASKAIAGRAPVHLVWTREDDIKGGFYRPMVLHRVRAGLTADGRISGWQHQLVSKSIFAGTPFETALIKNGLDPSSVEGISDTDYAIDDFDVRQHNVTTSVPVLWWRSVGNSHAAFVMETIMDELAASAGKDPVEFRVDLLSHDPRDVAVIRLAAEKSGWEKSLMGERRGRGIAFHHSFGTRVAMVAEVTVHQETIKVDRIVTAVDAGVPVNPDVIAAQVEGAVGFALSMALRNQITLRNGIVQQSNFDDYEPTRMREMPKVEIHIVNSTDPPSGIGEPGVPPIAPAIGNAAAVATGKRFHSLPLGLATLAG
jgi:isoquinoline 1-oxidoreductase beta subunit